MANKERKFKGVSLMHKILFIMLALSVVPLVVLGIIASNDARDLGYWLSLL